VRLDDEQLRARQAGAVRDQLLLHRDALPGETRHDVGKLADLAAKTVVSTTGTTNYQLIRKLNEEGKLGINLIGAKDHAESALLVETGRAVAFAMDDILLYGLRASAQDPSSLAVVGDPIQVEPYAIMLRRDDPAFQKLVDDTIVGLVRSGEFRAALPEVVPVADSAEGHQPAGPDEQGAGRQHPQPERQAGALSPLRA
jgi:ABC-type amino acid transport substrate-binding protein